LKLLEVINAEDALYLILEYMPFGSIAKSSEKIPKVERDEHKEHDRQVLRLWMRDMVSGLAYLHSQRICHSDIKPENILVGEDGVLKLADFGLSRLLIQGQSSAYFDQKDGTLAFQAPECLDENIERKFSMFPTDIWALGVTLYQLKYGHLPFHGEDDHKLTWQIKNGSVEIPESEDEDFKKMITAMLEKNPAKRMTVKELCRDAWITDGGNLDDLVSSYDCERVSSEDLENALEQYRDLQLPRLSSDSTSSVGRSKIRTIATTMDIPTNDSKNEERQFHSRARCKTLGGTHSPAAVSAGSDFSKFQHKALTRTSYRDLVEFGEVSQRDSPKERDFYPKSMAKAMLKQSVTEKNVKWKDSMSICK